MISESDSSRSSRRPPGCRRIRAAVPFLLLALAFAAGLAYDGQTGPEHRELIGDPWRSREAAKLGDYFTFYYFNPDGDGIYRFGRLGKVLTERFNWTVSGGLLELKFLNTGERRKTRYRVGPADGREGVMRLVLEKDPREGEKAFEYFRPDKREREGIPRMQRWQHVIGF